MTLLAYLENGTTLPRSANGTPSGLVYASGDLTDSISNNNRKPNYYLVVIGILSGLHVIVMSVFIPEFVNNKDKMTRLEQMQFAVNNAEKLQKLLSSNLLDYIWGLCNRTTLQCSRCLPGWTEHASRCFFLSNVEKNWENARVDCLNYKGDLAIVLNAADQVFLTKMTFQVKKASPNGTFQSAWIGLQDMVKEGVHFWVNGDKLKVGVIYWRPREPNNDIAAWDIEQAGQDCVTIIPPDEVVPEDWMNSWDDISCVEKRHYICETNALILT